MTFASLEYLIFFGIVLSLTAITNIKLVQSVFRKNFANIRHGILFLASYIFYGWWDWRFCFLMLFVSLITYIAGIKNQHGTTVIAIFVLLGILGIFKYFNFFIDSFLHIMGLTGYDTINIILPVGISFYIFQAISYIIDVSRKQIPQEDSFFRVALYISFFPQLVAGPIVRASDFLYQLREERTVTWKNIETGIQIFAVGLFKKIVLADRLSVFVDEVYENPNIFSGGTIILAAISYSLQIYFDFSGYSDMAIGSAKCLGYDLPRNFNLPYLSKNISEFWKRWHISLSEWLKQYLYIPLGGNRKGKIRTYINLMITMLLGGLWHGANWTFVIWGGINGIALCIHKCYLSFCQKYKIKLRNNKIVNFISALLTFFFVTFCWIFFRSGNFETAMLIIKRILFMSAGINHAYSYSILASGLLIIASVVSIIKSKKESQDSTNGFYIILKLNQVVGLMILFVFVGITIGLAYTGASPFIYFQF